MMGRRVKIAGMTLAAAHDNGVVTKRGDQPFVFSFSTIFEVMRFIGKLFIIQLHLDLII